MLDCPSCGKRKCFDAADPIVDESLCGALRAIRAMRDEAGSAPMPPTALNQPSGGNTGEDGASIAPESNGNADGTAALSPDEGIGPDVPLTKKEDCNDGGEADNNVDTKKQVFKEEDTDASDDESRFSTNPDDDEEEELEENQTSIEQPDSLAPIQQSCLISRKHLHYLTGGKQGGHKNPLNVATPMNHCGAPAFATKDGTVIHICIKEEMNDPPPNDVNEEFLLYRTTKGSLARDIQLLIQHPNHPDISVFWEPKDQEKTNVMYVGHWKVSDIEDYSRNPITYMGIKRCARVKLRFVDFNQRWADIIHWCQGKSDAEIISKNWDDDAGEGNGSK